SWIRTSLSTGHLSLPPWTGTATKAASGSKRIILTEPGSSARTWRWIKFLSSPLPRESKIKSSSMRLAAAVLLAGSLAFCAETGTLSAKYAETADHLVTAALADTNGYKRLAYLTDRIGNRLSGSASLDKAVAWSVEQMKAAGLSNVRKIPTKVPHWVRGQESAELLQPVAKSLHMIGIGMSVGTPPRGITADAVVVSNFDELEKLGRSVRGKIVVFNAPFESYGKTVAYRAFGPSRAAALGAVAVLVRSITPLAMQQPHTGA